MKYREVDVIVIGGGITGCSTAWELTKRRQKVIVLEKGHLASEGSGRNGGGVRQQNHDSAERPLAMGARRIWETMKTELDRDVEYRQNGNLRLIRDEEEAKQFQEILDIELEMGLTVEMLSTRETRSLVPALSQTTRLLGGKYCPTDGTANPLLVTRAIACAAERLGAEFHEHEPVKSIEVENDKVVAVKSLETEYRAAVFVLAAGAHSRNICQSIGLDFPVEIKRSQILVTEPLPPLIGPFISADVGYMRQALNGGIHFGVRSTPVENFDTSTSLMAFQKAGSGYLDLIPIMGKAHIIRSWAGLTDWTPDAKPIIDQAPQLEGIVMASGFSGHGFCLGPIVGRLLAEWIVDGAPSLDLTAFRWDRFQTEVTL
jgi:sarcosine oxidase subunit beta